LKRNITTAFKILFFLAIGVFFIWIFLRQLTPEQKQEIWQSFFNANYAWLLLSIALGVLSHIIRAYRWNSLLEPMGYHPKVKNTFFAVMVGYLANTAVPRLGEVTRCGVLSKYENVPVNKSFGTVLVERSIDLITFVLLFFINFFLFYDKLRIYVDEKILAPLTDKFNLSDKSYVYLLIIAALLVISGLLFFLLRSRIRHFKLYQKIKILLLGFWQGLWAVTKIKRPMVFVLQSLMIWFLYYLMIFVCFFSLPQTSHLGLEVAFSLLIFGSIGIMLVQGGVGIYPAIIAETLVLYNISPVHGYALGWLGWTAQTLMIVITGLVSLLLLPLFNKSKDHAKS
jgi:glycosyltransferase 2 family protein